LVGTCLSKGEATREPAKGGNIEGSNPTIWRMVNYGVVALKEPEGGVPYWG